MKDNKEIHDKAWNLLEEKGLTLGQRIMVRSSFIEWSGYKDEYPFITVKYSKNQEVESYRSEYEMIKSLMFKTQEEVILANAIYVNLITKNQNFNNNDFIPMFKYTCRIIGIDTDWSK
jgi:hypothetical protein